MAHEFRVITSPALPHRQLRLTVEGMTKAFNGRPAIESVSLTVSEHEFVAVLGPSGAGKTTLFRCVTGLLAPDRGTSRIGLDDITALRGNARRRVAVVFQQFNLVSRLTALDNVLAGRLGYVPAWRGWLRRFDRRDRLLALECLDRVGLLGHAAQRSDRLSGGQQQRVAIARALAQEPDLILADEPVASLDPRAADSVLDLLADVSHNENLGVLVVLHQPDLARRYADRLVGFHDGRVAFDRPPAQVSDEEIDALYGDDDDER